MLTIAVAVLALAVALAALVLVWRLPSRRDLSRTKVEIAEMLATWEMLADRMTRNAKSAGARLGRALAEGGQTWGDDESSLDQLELVDPNPPPTLDDFRKAKGLDR